MAIVFESVTIGNANAANVTVDKPSGTASGNVLVAIWGVRANKSTGQMTLPTDFVEAAFDGGQNPSIKCAYKICGGSEPSSYTFSLNVSGNQACILARFSGVDNTTPIDVTGRGNAGNDQTAEALGVTTVTNGAMIVTGYCLNTLSSLNTLSDPDGMSLIYGQDDGTGNQNIQANYVEKATAGATGDKVSSIGFGAAGWASTLIALRPTAGGGSSYDNSVTLARYHDITESGLRTTAGHTTLARYHAVSNSGLLTGVASISLGRSHDLSVSGVASFYRSLDLDRLLSVSQAPGISVDRSLVLDRFHDLLTDGGISISGSLSLGKFHDILVAGNISIPGSIALARFHDILLNGGVSVERSLTLDKLNGMSASSILDAVAILSLGKDNAVTLSGGLNILGSVTLGVIRTISISAPNIPPVGVDDYYEVVQGQWLIVGPPGILANDTDVDSANLLAIQMSEPSHGSLIFGSDGSFSYFSFSYGLDSFAYVPNDGHQDGNVTTVEIFVRRLVTGSLGLSSVRAISDSGLVAMNHELQLGRSHSISEIGLISGVGNLSLGRLHEILASGAMSYDRSLELARALGLDVSGGLAFGGSVDLAKYLSVAQQGHLDAAGTLNLSKSDEILQSSTLDALAEIALSTARAIAQNGSLNAIANIGLGREHTVTPSLLSEILMSLSLGKSLDVSQSGLASMSGSIDLTRQAGLSADSALVLAAAILLTRSMSVDQQAQYVGDVSISLGSGRSFYLSAGDLAALMIFLDRIFDGKVVS